jgi:hypothetical protein
VAVTSIFLFEWYPFMVQAFSVTAIMLLMVVIGLFNARFSKVRENPLYFRKELILLPDSTIELNKQQYEIGLNSRIGILGCWLCLRCSKGNKVKSETHFIFKSSVSDYHYSQLCRVIKRNAFHAD